MKDHNKQIRSLTEAVNNLYEQVGDVNDVNGEDDWGEPPDWWEGPWPPQGPIIIPGDHQQDEEGWVPPLGWPHVVLSVLAMLGQGYSIWAIAAILGIPLSVVLMIVAGLNYYPTPPTDNWTPSWKPKGLGSGQSTPRGIPGHQPMQA